MMSCTAHRIPMTMALIATLAIATACNAPADPQSPAKATSAAATIAKEEDAGCGGTSAPDRPSAVIDVPDRHVLFGFSQNGTLYRGSFNGGPWTVIQSHDWNDVNGAISPDGRWVVYGGDLQKPYEELIGNPDAEELWLFDVQTQRSRRILQRPFASMIAVNAVFSPDNRRAAVFSSFDDRTAQDRRSGLFLIDLVEGSTKSLGFSQQSVPGKGDIHGSPSWSTDGRLYLLYGKEDGFQYTKVDPSTGRSEPVTGRYVRERHEHEFIVSGQPVNIQDNRDFPSRYMHAALASPDGTRNARIDDEYRLNLDATGASHVVAEGRYDECEGVTIGLTGWLDNDHFIYRNKGRFHVHQTTTGRSRPIDFGPVDGMNFFWSSEAPMPSTSTAP